MDWSIVLFLAKWVLLALVYLFLGMIMAGITREMSVRLPMATSHTSAISYGRMRVLQAGSDNQLQPGTVLVLHPETRLGARRGNSILLRDRYISGNHARLRWDGVSWWVEDMNSTNGTFVNRKRVQPGFPETISFGATLQLGDMSFEMIE